MNSPTKINKEAELDKKLSEIQQDNLKIGQELLAKKIGLSFSDLSNFPVNTEALNIIDENTARSSLSAIINKKGFILTVALIDPSSPKTDKTLKSLEKKGFKLEIIVTTIKSLETIWSKYKNTKTIKKFEVGAVNIDKELLSRIEGEIKDINDLKDNIAKVPVTEILEMLIAGSIKTEASDIHMEPSGSNTNIRYRLDGILNDIASLNNNYYQKVTNRVKILSGIKLNIHNKPQDGRFTIKTNDTAIEVRVSIIPSEFGETIVMRLLDPRTLKNNLDDLGVRKDLLDVIKKQIKKPNGAILNTGPTGSGKTTTLYAFIKSLNSPETKIITIEDPIEYHLRGISQTQVNTESGYNFTSGLKAIVRQDPDIILIGEIRDKDTAEIALNASLTGHLVFSTIHTSDSAGTIPRLVDLGVKPPAISPAINMILAQRLIRKLCTECREKRAVSKEELIKIKATLAPIKTRFTIPELDASLELYYSGKCKSCNNSGYKNRIGVFEGFTISRDMERLILKNPSISDIRDLTISEGMVTLVQDAYLKLLDGTTSIDEIDRVIE